MIRDDLDPSWFCLHSLGITTHVRKPWAEIDFVLVGPPGVFCLEVKGGRVSRRSAMWVFTNRHGVESIKAEGPFEQVATASAALAGYLHGHLPSLLTAPVGYGVVLPDIIFDAVGPDVTAEIVYDGRDVGRPFGDYIERLIGHWRKRIQATSKRAQRTLQSDEVRAAIDLLRGDFDCRPSLRATVGAVNQELLRLTTEQYRILDGLADNPRVFVSGGAGTGKTLLAVEEAKRHSDAGRRVLLTCFNRNLSDYLRARLGGHPKVTCETLHRTIARVVAGSGRSAELPRAAEEDLLAVYYPQLCADVLLKDSSAERYDVLIVDEAQDLLTDAYVGVLDALLGGGLKIGVWRLFFDPHQNVYEATAVSALRRVLELDPVRFRLSTNCRNTAPIATATGLLADLDADEVLVVEGPDVAFCWYTSGDERLRLLADEVRRLLDGGISPEEIVILSRTNEDVAAAARLTGVPCGIVLGATRIPGKIRSSTIASFKGLEADAVVLARVDRLNTPEADAALYVGASRARSFLSVLLDHRVKADYQTLASKLGGRIGQAGVVAESSVRGPATH